MSKNNELPSHRAASSFISNLTSGHIDALESLFAPGATYWVSGDPEKVPWAGELPFAERLPQLKGMRAGFQTFEAERQKLVTDGQTAVLEFKLVANDAEGGQYRNDMVLIITVDDDGKIVLVSEYMDSMRALAYLQSKEKPQ